MSSTILKPTISISKKLLILSGPRRPELHGSEEVLVDSPHPHECTQCVANLGEAAGIVPDISRVHITSTQQSIANIISSSSPAGPRADQYRTQPIPTF